MAHLNMKDYFKKEGIDYFDDKWKLYRFVMFFECERFVLKEDFIEFFNNHYLKYQAHFDRGCKVAFSRLINGEISRIARFNNIEMSLEENENIAAKAIGSTQAICSWIYSKCEGPYENYHKYFIDHHEEISKFTNI